MFLVCLCWKYPRGRGDPGTTFLKRFEMPDNKHYMNHRNRKPRGKTNRSQCADVIVRGTPHQLVDKYKSLAEETNDTVLKEQYLQHAEHYQREINV